jgi:antitoxin ParD1/3/4
MRTTMNISIPKPLKNWVEEQVEQRGYGTASEFIRELIRQKRDAERDREAVEAKLLDALKSGDSTPMTRKDWDKIKRSGLKRLRAVKAKHA